MYTRQVGRGIVRAGAAAVDTKDGDWDCIDEGSNVVTVIASEVVGDVARVGAAVRVAAGVGPEVLAVSVANILETEPHGEASSRYPPVTASTNPPTSAQVIPRHS